MIVRVRDVKSGTAPGTLHPDPAGPEGPGTDPAGPEGQGTDPTGPAGQPARTPPRSVLARGLMLLNAFGPQDADLSLAELSERCGLPKPTVLRLARELVEWDALERTRLGYRLGLMLFVLGQRVPHERELREAALPHLEDLYEATHENVHLCVLDGVHALFLEKVNGRRSMPIGSRIGGRMPAYCTSTGKVLLAHAPGHALARVIDAGLVRYTPRTIVLPAQLKSELTRALERGYAVNREEAEVGVSAVAAPVYGPERQVIAAISVAGYSQRLNLEQLAPAVRAAAAALSRDLSGPAPFPGRALAWPRPPAHRPAAHRAGPRSAAPGYANGR